MKLLDILARDLKVWPTNLDDNEAVAVAQDDDGCLVTLDPCVTACAAQFDGLDWSRTWWTGTGIYLDPAEDLATAIITREQWEAVVSGQAAPEALPVAEPVSVTAPKAPARKELPGVPTLDLLERRKLQDDTWKACCEAWQRELVAAGVRVVK